MESTSKSSCSMQQHSESQTTAVSLFVTTFNVNGKAPSGLHHWFNFEASWAMPDVVAIGLQEMDIAWGNYVRESNVRQSQWLLAISHLLPAGGTIFLYPQH